MKHSIPEISKVISNTESSEQSSNLSLMWLKIEKHKKRNANYSQKLTKFFDKFKLEVFPYEQKQSILIAAQVKHLISFIAKKSLTENQREELLDWIMSDIDYLDAHPFADENVDTAILKKGVSEALQQLAKNDTKPIDDDAIEQLEGMIDDMFDGKIQLDRDELIDIIKNPDLFPKYVQEALENIATEEDSPEDDADEADDFFEKGDYHQHHERFEEHIGKHGEHTLEKLFKDSQLNKMYKRLASKLHPDKENDTEKKAVKHELMQTLAAARKSKDIFTMLTLYNDHINDDSFTFDEDTIAAIELLLEQKISELNYEYRRLKADDSPKSIVWSRFKGRSNKLTAKYIQNHIDQLQEEFGVINHLITNTSTVKALKVELSSRIQQKKSIPPFNFGGSLEDIFNMGF